MTASIGWESPATATAPSLEGAEKVVHFGSDWSGWKSFVEVVDNMTAITWGIVVGGGDQALHARLDLSWWS